VRRGRYPDTDIDHFASRHDFRDGSEGAICCRSIKGPLLALIKRHPQAATGWSALHPNRAIPENGADNGARLFVDLALPPLSVPPRDLLRSQCDTEGFQFLIQSLGIRLPIELSSAGIGPGPRRRR